MNQKMGMAEFFAMEAGDYLDRLDTLVSSPDAPATEELLRLTRALRGSALMANKAPIAGVAASFENLARAMHEGRCVWAEGIRQLCVRAVDDLRILVRAAVAQWGSQEDAKAKNLAAELDSVTGQSAAAAQPTVSREADAGTRAFIAREGAAVASALKQSAQSQTPLGTDSMQAVLKAMQPLRGVASLRDFPPLTDLLDGVQRAIDELTRRSVPQPDASALFDAAARALSRAAREVAAAGKPDADSPEASEFAQLLGKVLDLAGEVAEAVGGADEAEAPAGPAQLSGVEFVAHGEHLRLAADQLDGAQSATQKELRSQSLVPTFRALATARGDQLGAAAAEFGKVARESVARGLAVNQTAGFTQQLREAAAVLASAVQGEAQALAQRLNGVTSALRVMAAAAAPEPAAPPPAAQPTAAIAAAPVGQPAAAPPPAAEPAVEQETADLVGSILRYEKMASGPATPEPSLEHFLAGGTPSAAPPIAKAPPAAAAVPEPAARPITEFLATEEPAEAAIPVTELCYSGSAALERAMSLREDLRAALAERTTDTTQLTELIEEVFDLVQLGIKQ